MRSNCSIRYSHRWFRNAMMPTMLAAGTACLGMHNGAGLSKERNHNGLTLSASGWPVETLVVAQSDGSGCQVAKAGLLLGDLQSLPHVIMTRTSQSLIDVMQEKWCAFFCFRSLQKLQFLRLEEAVIILCIVQSAAGVHSITLAARCRANAIYCVRCRLAASTT